MREGGYKKAESEDWTYGDKVGQSSSGSQSYIVQRKLRSFSPDHICVIISKNLSTQQKGIY